MQRLSSSGLIDDLQVVLASEITDELVQLVHPEAYLNHIVDSEPAHQVIKVDPDTYMNKGSLRAAKLAAGACAEATQRVLDGSSKQAFCAIRPPGHHAEVATAMGFCLFNNIAIATELALQHRSVQRVAIVDFDVHHCNGTVDIFKDREEVLVCSSFQNNFYPYRYLDFSNEHILNTPLDAGTTGDVFRRHVEKDWLPALTAHQPDFIFVSAGFDAHINDPLGELRFTDPDFEWVTRLLQDIASQYAGGRLVSTLEGGYDLDALAGSVATHVATLLDYRGIPSR